VNAPNPTGTARPRTSRPPQPAPRKAPWIARIAPWLLSVAAAAVTVGIMIVLSEHGHFTATQLMLAVPGAISIAMVPGAWRKAYRWVAIAVLANLVYPATLSLFLVVAFAWAIHQTWATERANGQIRPARLARTTTVKGAVR